MPKINPIIFKSYDIRGIYPEELNEEAAFEIGRAFVEHVNAKEILVGRDMRISSPQIFSALVKGIISQGADVVDLGQIATECLYFAMGKHGYKGAMMITASHNPKEYNGFKMLKGNVDIVRGTDLKPILEKLSDKKTDIKEGTIKKLDIWQEYADYILSLVDLSKIKHLKVIIDAGNGMAGKMIPLLQKKLPIEIIPINFNLDGNFPAHPSNPLLEGTCDQIKKEVLTQKADVGFIFDGDADRIFIVDEKGQFIRGDITLLLLADYFLKKTPGSAIVYNTICSKAVPLIIKKWGGRAVRTQVGAVNVKEELTLNNGMVGGEVSGHFSFKDNFSSDSGGLAFLILLQIISEENKKISELTKEFSPFAKGPEINFETSDKEKILEEIKKQYSDGKQEYLDGVTVDYDNWWFNIRSSNTEPLVRLTIEADTEEILEEKKKELMDFVVKFL